jgi:hypothetical protein
LSGTKSVEDEANKTLEVEVASPSSGNDTLTLGADVTFEKIQSGSNVTFEKLTLGADTTFEKTQSVADATFEKVQSGADATFEKVNSRSDATFEKIQNGSNATFDAVAESENVNDKTVDLGKGDESANKTVNLSEHEKVNDKTIDLGTAEVKEPEVTSEIPEVFSASWREEQQDFLPNQVPKISSKSSSPEKSIEVLENSTENSKTFSEREIVAAVNNAAEYEVPEKFDSTFSEIEQPSPSPDLHNVSSAQPAPSPDVSKEAAESTLPDSPAPEEEFDVTMEDISDERQQVVSSFPQDPEPIAALDSSPITTQDSVTIAAEIPIVEKIQIKTEPKEETPEPEIRYRNIDDLGRSNKTATLSDQHEEVPEETHQQQQQLPSPSEKVFTEKMENSFEVQFKMPAPVFKPQNEVQPPQQVTDADFGCGSSCKGK